MFMSYTIRYGPDLTKKYRKRPVRFGGIGIVMILSACLLLASWCLPQQAKQFKEALFPWTRAEVVAAFSELRESILEGEPCGDAVTAFCRDVIHGSTVSE